GPRRTVRLARRLLADHQRKRALSAVIPGHPKATPRAPAAGLSAPPAAFVRCTGRRRYWASCPIARVLARRKDVQAPLRTLRSMREDGVNRERMRMVGGTGFEPVTPAV